MNSIRPQSMIITLYGDYIRHVGGSIWIGSLIRLLGYFGLSQQAVRSTVSRMTRRGMLRIDRVGTRSYYSLTDKSSRMMEEGAARIFHFHSPRDAWDGQWHLVTYSVPENEREARDRFRQELEWMGFGMLTNALWISPHDYRREIEQLAEGLGLRARVELFTARHDGFADAAMIVARCWNLAAINSRYIAFVEKHKPEYEEYCRRLELGTDLEPSEYFVRRFNLIHEYRRFPYIDPELPAELLPTDWRGTEAAALFRHYHDQLASKANAFFYSVYEQPRGFSVPHTVRTSEPVSNTPARVY
ncbi:MAG: phenylacetic acid degradation operon negative regulatory protein PaaX [Chloroflexi bacterium]|nr:phenylacetic acid degradation operon negative regulatory protein PaaX [Chloroflexota bacterium]